MATSSGATSASMTRRALALGYLYGAVCVAIFSSFVLISRIGMRTDLAVPDLLALRFGVGGLILAPVLVRSGMRGARLRDAVTLAVLGGLGFAVLAYAGIARTPTTHATVFLHGTLPLSTALIIAAYARVWPSYHRLVGISAISVGVAAMACDSLANADRSQLLGDAMLFAAATLWSAYAVFAQVRNISALQAAAFVAVFSSAIYIPIYVALGRGNLINASLPDLILQTLFQGVIIGVVSIFAYTRATALLGPTSAALLTTIVPTITTVLAIPLLGEWPSVIVAVGIVITTVGMVIALREIRPKEPRTE